MQRLTLTKVKADNSSSPVWKRLVKLAHKKGIKVYFANIGTGVYLRTRPKALYFLEQRYARA